MRKKIVKFDQVEFINQYIEELKHCLDTLDREMIKKAIDMLMHTYSANKKIFILGNGGSASNASHMACDLGKGTLKKFYDDKEKRFRVISLTDNVAIMTAFANDLSYEDIFAQQLKNLVEKGDLLIVMSGSGNSPNVIKAVKYANKNGAKTIGLLGFRTGGKLGKLVNIPVIVDSNSYGPCEDIQLVLDHIITSWITKIKSHHDKKLRAKN